ncbi:MAG: F0F1 ATP synthase subunit A [Ignavibacteriales bacterium]|nr:F0F1 ATP synthase subunit A [Ignavibacteriales bacterium]
MLTILEKAAADTSKALADTAAVASHGAGEHGEKFEFSHLLDHIKDGREVEIPFGHFELPHIAPVNIGGMVIDLSPTKHVFFLALSALLLVVVALYAASRYKKSLVPSGLANAFESLVLFIRDEVAIPNMGKGGVRYVPYLLTTFFFILMMNVIGLVPFGATPTGNIAVTAGLAIIAFFMIQISAIRAQGFGHYLAHLTGGVHWLLWPIMVPIEILGLFTKPFALCIRLFANMTGGHIVILSLIGLIFLFRSFVVAPVSVLFALGINMLELFVAFLQAYVFTMLTSLFMGLGMQSGHEEHAHSESH